MTIVDSSVWIDFFNGKLTAATDCLDALLGKQEVAIGDLIALEVLQGFRRDKDYETAKSALSELRQYTMLNPSLAAKGADNYRLLRKKGITIRKTADIIIATFCIEQQLPLLHADKDFAPFAQYLDLKVVRT